MRVGEARHPGMDADSVEEIRRRALAAAQVLVLPRDLAEEACESCEECFDDAALTHSGSLADCDPYEGAVGSDDGEVEPAMNEPSPTWMPKVRP